MERFEERTWVGIDVAKAHCDVAIDGRATKDDGTSQYREKVTTAASQRKQAAQ